jgi:broad specificity phosphatase PhoE
MQTFYLIRHGQKQPTAGEPELTPLGHQQAAATGNFLRQFPIQKIYASPSYRTMQTAEYFSKALRVPVEVDTLLRERANWGDDPEQTFEQFLQMWGKATHDRDYQPPVGDSSLQAGKRIEQMVDLIRQDDAPPSHVVLVTHGGVIGDFLRNLFGDEKLQDILKEFAYLHPGDYRVRECSLTVIEFEDRTPTLKLLASTAHLEPLKLTNL